MDAIQHANLFGGDRSPREVYDALQRDYVKEQRTIRWMDAVFVVCAVAAVWVSHGAVWVWIFLAIGALVSRVCCFIDNANRNWAMHLIDWMEHARAEHPRDV